MGVRSEAEAPAGRSGAAGAGGFAAETVRRTVCPAGANQAEAGTQCPCSPAGASSRNSSETHQMPARATSV